MYGKAGKIYGDSQLTGINNILKTDINNNDGNEDSQLTRKNSKKRKSTKLFGGNNNNNNNNNDSSVSMTEDINNANNKRDSLSKSHFSMFLGSGGGSGNINSKECNGTNGGGCIIINCKESLLLLSENSSITANGDNNLKSIWCGCGSGGTIYIKSPLIINNGKICAIGGINKNGENISGAGGIGRIRIDCKKKYKKYVSDGSSSNISLISAKNIFSSNNNNNNDDNSNKTKDEKLIEKYNGTGTVVPKVGHWHTF